MLGGAFGVGGFGARPLRIWLPRLIISQTRGFTTKAQRSACQLRPTTSTNHVLVQILHSNVLSFHSIRVHNSYTWEYYFSSIDSPTVPSSIDTPRLIPEPLPQSTRPANIDHPFGHLLSC